MSLKARKIERRRSVQTFDFSKKKLLQETEAWSTIRANLTHLFENGYLSGEMEDLMGIVKTLLVENPAITFQSIMLKSLNISVHENLERFCNELRKCPVNDFFNRLKAIWVHFSGTVLPYIQGLFLPLEEKLEERSMGMTIQKIVLAEFRDSILLDEEVKKKLEKGIMSCGKILPPIILQMVEVIKRIQSFDMAEKELHVLFANTAI